MTKKIEEKIVMEEVSWHALSVKKVFSLLKTDLRGLSSKKAGESADYFGKNEIADKVKKSNLTLLINQIKSPLVYVMVVAGSISLFLGHVMDSSVIFIVVFVNTAFGFWQEKKADDAIAKLRKIIRQQAKVFRDGRLVQIDIKEIVPGDIIEIKAGDKVPADARLIEIDGLQTVEANLTGESAPIEKIIGVTDKGATIGDRKNMVYMGTVISRGWGRAVVCATGNKTEIGKISKMISETEEEITPLQLQLRGFSKSLTFLVVFLCILVFGSGLLLGKDPTEMFITSVALAVAAIPEGLLVSVTIILALGMQASLKKKALVRKLVAAETIGSTSVICTDKTGTLTEGKMMVYKIITADREYEVEKDLELTKIEKTRDLISKISLLCSSAEIENPQDALEEMRVIGDPTEKAILISALSAGFDKEVLEKDYIKIQEVPFDSEKKYMATIHEHKSDKHFHIFAKGAPEKILAYCGQVMVKGKKKKMTKEDMVFLRKNYEQLAKKGLRVLALAYKTGKKFKDIDKELKDLVFLGFIAIKDPLRPEAKEVMHLCHQAGIRPIILTGDHKNTAEAIFKELGLKVMGNIIEGSELDKMDDKQLDLRLKEIDVYARVEPRHKLRIVQAWQRKGEVVAMTGDGINDAPALKAADIGIALGDSADVTKETADMILLDNNFRVIIDSIKQGRMIYDNIKKVVLYLLIHVFSEMILIIGSLILSLPLPVTALQILWINLISDGFPNLGLTVEPAEKNIMDDKPRPRKTNILDWEVKALIFIVGIFSDLLLFLVFWVLYSAGAEITYLRTILFAALALDALFYVFSIRSLRQSIIEINLFRNPSLIFFTGLSLVLLLVAVYWPPLQSVFKTVSLGSWEWLLICVLGLSKIFIIEMVKVIFNTIKIAKK